MAHQQQPVQPMSEEERKKAYIASLEKFRDPAYLNNVINKVQFDWAGHKAFKGETDEDDGDSQEEDDSHKDDSEGDDDDDDDESEDGGEGGEEGDDKEELDDWGRPLPKNRKKKHTAEFGFGSAAGSAEAAKFEPPQTDKFSFTAPSTSPSGSVASRPTVRAGAKPKPSTSPSAVPAFSFVGSNETIPTFTPGVTQTPAAPTDAPFKFGA